MAWHKAQPTRLESTIAQPCAQCGRLGRRTELPPDPERLLGTARIRIACRRQESLAPVDRHFTRITSGHHRLAVGAHVQGTNLSCRTSFGGRSDSTCRRRKGIIPSKQSKSPRSASRLPSLRVCPKGNSEIILQNGLEAAANFPTVLGPCPASPVAEIARLRAK